MLVPIFKRIRNVNIAKIICLIEMSVPKIFEWLIY